jgi:hypothetical protein
MFYKMMIVLMAFACCNLALGREKAAEDMNKTDTEATVEKANEARDKAAENEEMTETPELPAKDTAEYWIVRSQAMTEFIPFLTKKRTEVKKIRQFLADYLLRIEKADEFSNKKMPVVFDGKLYAEILRIREDLQETNIEIPQERPSWDALVEIAMQHIVFEGYWPTDIEEGDEADMYIEICKKKEAYGKKVRQDLRSILDQSAKMWRYLDSIGKLDDFKAYAADIILEQKAVKAKEKAIYAEMHREEVISRAADREQREFEDAEARASFRSSQRERYYQSRQDRLRYRQTRLDERYVNSRSYYY